MDLRTVGCPTATGSHFKGRPGVNKARKDRGKAGSSRPCASAALRIQLVCCQDFYRLSSCLNTRCATPWPTRGRINWRFTQRGLKTSEAHHYVESSGRRSCS